MKSEPSCCRSRVTCSSSGFLDMDVPGNEAANKAAKEAATITDDPPRSVSELQCEQIDPRRAMEHARTALVYKKINQVKYQAEVKTRKDAVFLAQIGSGHCLSFKAYQHLLNAAVDPTCPICGEGSHTLEHWFLECAGTESTRQDVFGDANLSLQILTDVTAHTLGQPCQSTRPLATTTTAASLTQSYTILCHHKLHKVGLKNLGLLEKSFSLS